LLNRKISFLWDLACVQALAAIGLLFTVVAIADVDREWFVVAVGFVRRASVVRRWFGRRQWNLRGLFTTLRGDHERGNGRSCHFVLLAGLGDENPSERLAYEGFTLACVFVLRISLTGLVERFQHD
jgi:hypothetical protein